MRWFLLSFLVFAGCDNKISGSKSGTADASPITYKKPPVPKEGSGTSTGCNGVTVAGECQNGKAIKCDQVRNETKTKDCLALGETCVEDADRGAQCMKLVAQSGPGTGDDSPCKASGGVSEVGTCTDGTALYCDNSKGTAITRTWTCPSNKTCSPGGDSSCAQHAFCCGGEEPKGDCGAIDFDGICEGDVVNWCSNDTLQTKDCSTTGQRCEAQASCGVDGAWCCGDVVGENTECQAVGIAGECTDSSTMRWCANDEFITLSCPENYECKPKDSGACGGSQADCCEIDSTGPTRCETLGSAGECTDLTTYEYCSGTDIVTINCDAGESCVKKSNGYADCIEGEVDPCTIYDSVGVCEDNIVKFCLSGSYNEKKCTDLGQTCFAAEEAGSCLPGLAECCPTP